MEQRESVVRAEEMEPFSLPGEEDLYQSTCIIAKDGVGSRDLMVSQATLFAGKSLPGAVHRDNDEAYYILRGKARLTLGGSPENGEGGKDYEVTPDTAIFIPAGTFHRLDNRQSDQNLVFLGIWPKVPTPGSNTFYDEREKAWGTQFRKRTSG
jgi:mannose-6-phosphate isomerase-like protein (cupin superfamily)